MKSTIEIKHFPEERTVRVRMSGAVTTACLRDFARQYEKVAEFYNGRPHLILADFRGMEPLDADAADVLGQTIQRSRRAGVTCCAHLSDETVQRLQASRLARQSSQIDDVTVDVVSLEEAERVLTEARNALPPSTLRRK